MTVRRALLDTCVLWPSLQRDFLLSLAVEGAFEPLLSEGVLCELEVHEELKLRERHVCDEVEAQQRAAFLVAQMRAAFADCIVTGWERLEGSFPLPDFDDEHVLAAAVAGRAEWIVTENLRDFPLGRVPSGIRVGTAREFLLEVVEDRPDLGAEAVRQISSRSGRLHAAQPVEQILDSLDRLYGLEDVTALIRLRSSQAWG